MIEDVLKSSGSNNGAGIKRTIYFGLAEDVLTWPTMNPAPATYEELTTHTTAIAMKSTKQMFKFLATVRKSSMLSESAGERGSMVSLNKLDIMRADFSPEIAGFIESHKNDEMVFIINDLSGNPRILGTEDLPAMFVGFSIPTGADVSDEKDVKISIESAGPLARFYGRAAAPLAVPLTPAI